MLSNCFLRLMVLSFCGSCLIPACGPKQVVKPTVVATEVKPKSLLDIYNEALEALGRSSLEESQNLLKQVRDKAEKDSPAYLHASYNLGLIQLKKKNYDAAKTMFEEVLQQKADYRSAAINLGAVLKHQKRYLEAISLYLEALKSFPRDPKIMNNLIVLYRLNRNYKEAEKTGYRLLARAPDNVEAYKNLTLVYFDQQKFEMAELLNINAANILEKRKKSDPSLKADVGIYNNLGMIYQNMNRPRDALAQFSKVIELDPDNLEALVNIGAMAHRYRDYARAVDVYQRAFLISQHPKVINGLAYAYYGLGKTQEAIDLFLRIIQEQPENKEALYTLGEIYYLFLRDYKKAVTYYGRYQKSLGSAFDPKDPVHGRLKAAQAKMQMAAQIEKEEKQEKKSTQELKPPADDAGKPVQTKSHPDTLQNLLKDENVDSQSTTEKEEGQVKMPKEEK